MENFVSVEVNMTIEANERAIAAKLRNVRVRACITLKEFAEALGVETEELESYENGSEDVPASVIALTCALSGVPFEYFFGEESYEPTIHHVAMTEKQAVLLS